MGSLLALTICPVLEFSKLPRRKVKKRMKQIEKPARCHDIRNMFRACLQEKVNNIDSLDNIKKILNTSYFNEVAEALNPPRTCSHSQLLLSPTFSLSLWREYPNESSLDVNEHIACSWLVSLVASSSLTKGLNTS